MKKAEINMFDNNWQVAVCIITASEGEHDIVKLTRQIVTFSCCLTYCIPSAMHVRCGDKIKWWLDDTANCWLPTSKALYEANACAPEKSTIIRKKEFIVMDIVD